VESEVRVGSSHRESGPSKPVVDRRIDMEDNKAGERLIVLGGAGLAIALILIALLVS
jgi:hypothetical protein